MTRTRVNLWSSPRNISTALMYAFAQLPGVAVVDEPLYAHYLARQPTEAEHPGREGIMAAQNADGAAVVEHLLTHDYGKPAVVFKQMTHHLLDLDRAFLGRSKNVLLIRDPRAILASFSKVVRKVTAEDIGVPQQLALFEQLKTEGTLTAVVDSRKLLLEPRRVLSALCERLDLTFDERMLRWEAGPRPEDGVWAPHWYANVHRSTGFQPYREKTYELRPELEAIAEACRPAYARMLEASL